MYLYGKKSTNNLILKTISTMVCMFNRHEASLLIVLCLPSPTHCQAENTYKYTYKLSSLEFQEINLFSNVKYQAQIKVNLPVFHIYMNGKNLNQINILLDHSRIKASNRLIEIWSRIDLKSIPCSIKFDISNQIKT